MQIPPKSLADLFGNLIQNGRQLKSEVKTLECRGPLNTHIKPTGSFLSDV